MPQPDPTAAYQVEELVNLGDWLRQEFSWRKADKVWHYEGRCARCGHRVDKPIRETVIFAFQEGRGADPELRTMRCNCVAEHAGAEGKAGCGAYWGLALKPTREAS